MRKLIVSATIGLVMPLLAYADGIPGMRGPDHFALTVPDLFRHALSPTTRSQAEWC